MVDWSLGQRMKRATGTQGVLRNAGIGCAGGSRCAEENGTLEKTACIW